MKLEDVLVVMDFLDVFSNDFLCLPLKWEKGFPIDLVPSTAPIFLPPYRMVPIELKKLKT